MNVNNVLYLAKYYAKARFCDDKRPILAGIKLTHRCTLKCRQCPYWQRPQPDLGWERVVEIMPELYKRGIRIVILEGGEPLLWKDGNHDINDIFREARKYFFCVGVTTNGTLPLDIPSDIIWVSIDGLRDTHDRLRGTSFDRIINNIQKSKHPKIFANITINRLNHNEVPEIIRFLTPLVKGITIQFFYPYPESEDLLLTWEERAKVLDILISLKKEGYPVTDSVLALETLKNNSWVCEPWMIANVEPDGTFNQGCYLKNRTVDDNPCRLCGFAAHTEISLAYQLHWSAIVAGKEILGIF
ncbi:MAG: radical SAM protein [Eubacteriales bacterium]